MQRRWRQRFGVFVAALVVAAGCSGDDDGAADSTSPSVDSAVPDTTEPPPTSSTSTTSTTSTVPPSTTQSEEDLKAQIAADYQRSWQLRRELIANPTLEGVDEKLAQISAPGSEDYNRLREFVTELVNLGERVLPASPDEFRIDVEGVELTGESPPAQARVTFCFVANQVRVDAGGNAVLDNGLVASRSSESVVSTPNGWLPNGAIEDHWQALGVTECPPA